MSRLLVSAVAILLIFVPAGASAQHPSAAEIARAKARAMKGVGPSCDMHPEFAAADFSIPLNAIRTHRGGPLVLGKLKAFGVKTIIRYYDWEDETIPCKTLRDDELDAIFKEGFSVAVVFQHYNPEPMTFLDPARAVKDAQRSLELAEANGQPYGSAIYFGVDGAEGEITKYVKEFQISKGGPISAERKKRRLNAESGENLSEKGYQRYLLNYEYFRANYKTLFPNKNPLKIGESDMLPHINAYFKAIKLKFNSASNGDGSRTYKLGVYGSGVVNFYMRKNNPDVAYFWLAQARGWSQYVEYLDSRKWDMWQQYPTKCTSWHNGVDKRVVEFDWNMVRGDIGEWSTRRTDTKPLERPLKSCRS